MPLPTSVTDLRSAFGRMSVLLLLLLLSWAASAEHHHHAVKKPPHIIFSLVDDLGWNDMGWNDKFGQIRSPKIDALRNESIKLDQYYVYRFCSPSRSTFLTGRYPWHIGQQTTQNLNPMPGIACGINLKYKFIAQVLKERANYTTWALGKQHQGFLTKEYTPTYRGFDRYLGYYSGAEEHFTHEKQGTGDNISASLWAYDLANNTGDVVAPCLAPVGNGSATYSSYLYGNETLRMLDAHNPDVPLYVYLAWNNVHDPNEAPQNYIDAHSKIQDDNRRNLAAMVSALDDQLTAVVDKLKDKAMWANTIFVFSTDNGGNLGGSGINYPLRGGKYTFWQGGCRALGFVGGGLIPPHRRGTTWDGAIHAADWYSTFASLAGVSVDGTGPLAADGVDVSNGLLTGGPSPRNEVVLQVVSNSSGNDHSLPPDAYCDAVRGRDEFEHCRPPGGGVYGETNESEVGLSCGVLIRGRYKLLWGYPGWYNQAWNGWITPPSADKAGGGEAEAEGKGNRPMPSAPCGLEAPCLFDIIADPTEHHDIVAEHPEIVASMKSRILELLKGEVTLASSGLCPTSLGTQPDTRMTAKARQSGFWEPWLEPEDAQLRVA